MSFNNNITNFNEQKISKNLSIQIYFKFLGNSKDITMDISCTLCNLEFKNGNFYSITKYSLLRRIGIFAVKNN